MQSAAESFQLALDHLERVNASWDDPTDWPVLATFASTAWRHVLLRQVYTWRDRVSAVTLAKKKNLDISPMSTVCPMWGTCSLI